MIGALARVGLAEATPHGPGGWPWGTYPAGTLLLGLSLVAGFAAVVFGHWLGAAL